MIPLIIFLSSIVTLLLILLLLYLLLFIRPRGRMPQNKALLCGYAHRGLHGNGVPENSLAAFELACQKGYGIELDVQLSRDKCVMVFHDYTLVRMTGCDKKVCELDKNELRQLSLSKTNEKIPTFEEVLKLVSGRVPILVELKGEDLNTELCHKVAEHLKKYTGDYCIESFNPLLIRTVRKLLPDKFYGLLYTNVCREKKKRSALNIALSCMSFNFLARPDFIAYNKEDRDSLPVKITTKFYRAPGFVWTVRSKEELDLAHSLGEYPIFEHI